MSWPYLLLAKLLPALPSGSRDTRQKRSFGIPSCLQTGDLVLEVKGSHRGFLWSGLCGEVPFSPSAHQRWQCGMYRVRPVSWEEQGLFPQTNCELRSSCRDLAPRHCSRAGGFAPLQSHPLPGNCELPLLPAITLHCLICNPAKSLVSRTRGIELWRLITHFLCPAMILCLASSSLW